MTATKPAERTTCEECRSSMLSDQQWCLECGAARAVIHRPPDWRIGVVIVGVVVLLVGAAFAVALINLSSSANRTASLAASATTPTQTAPATPPATSITSSTTSHSKTTSTSASKTSTATSSSAAASVGAGTSGFSGWAVGLSGYTAVLATAHSQAQAVARARRLQASGLAVGVTSSSQHPGLPAGQWLVFSGRYPTLLDAQSAATALDARGFSAHALRIGRPGG